MNGIFDFFGSILGYLLWFLYTIFKNYGVAIILFTIITKLIMFPFTLKQQKSMAAQSKLSSKQAELQKMYGSNRQKYSEELQKLYDKEGVSPTSGCLTTLIPFPIMLGIFYSVTAPLSNTLHIAKETVTLATDYVSRIPGIIATGAYTELEVVKNFSFLRDKLTMFSPEDMEKIDFLSGGFDFFGIDLFAAPSSNPFSIMILIPILSLVFSFATQIYMQRKNKTQSAAQGQGCMKVMMYLLPLLSVYWSYSFPAAVGLYWTMSSAVTFLQSVITNMFFSTNHLVARGEASREVTMELAEAKMRPLSASAQAQLASKIEAGNRQQQEKQQKQQKNSKKKPGKKK